MSSRSIRIGAAAGLAGTILGIAVTLGVQGQGVAGRACDDASSYLTGISSRRIMAG